MWSTLSLKGRQNFSSKRNPVLLAARHGVQLVLQGRGEPVVHVLGEVAGEELVDDAAHVGGVETLLVELDVFPVLQCGDDGRVGRRSADTVLLQAL